MNFQPRQRDLIVVSAAKPRRRIAIAIALVVGAIALGAAGYVGYDHFYRRCGDCGSPILCTDPCVLPHFS